MARIMSRLLGAGGAGVAALVCQPSMVIDTNRLEVRADIEISPDPDKTMLPKFAAHYSVPIEMLDQPGDRATVTFNVNHVVTFG